MGSSAGRAEHIAAAGSRDFGVGTRGDPDVQTFGVGTRGGPDAGLGTGTGCFGASAGSLAQMALGWPERPLFSDGLWRWGGPSLDGHVILALGFGVGLRTGVF